MLRWLVALIALALWAAPVPAVAATIVWGLPTTISGDSDVSTLGTTLSAHNIAGSTVTINGVTFDATAFGNISPHFILTGTAPFGNASYGSADPPFADLSLSYRDLLNSAGFEPSFSPSDTPDSMTLSIIDLTVGLPYEFQWWVNDSSGNIFDLTTTATSGIASVTLEHNAGNALGGVGQFAVGTFVADATTQTIVFQGAGTHPARTQINGFQLRVIPEPGTGLLSGAGLLALCARRRRHTLDF